MVLTSGVGSSGIMVHLEVIAFRAIVALTSENRFTGLNALHVARAVAKTTLDVTIPSLMVIIMLPKKES